MVKVRKAKSVNGKSGFVARKAIRSFETGRKRSMNTIAHSRSSYSVKSFKLS